MSLILAVMTATKALVLGSRQVKITPVHMQMQDTDIILRLKSLLCSLIFVILIFSRLKAAIGTNSVMFILGTILMTITFTRKMTAAISLAWTMLRITSMTFLAMMKDILLKWKTFFLLLTRLLNTFGMAKWTERKIMMALSLEIS